MLELDIVESRKERILETLLLKLRHAQLQLIQGIELLVEFEQGILELPIVDMPVGVVFVVLLLALLENGAHSVLHLDDSDHVRKLGLQVYQVVLGFAYLSV